MRVFGIDCGTEITGFGVVESCDAGRQPRLVCKAMGGIGISGITGYGIPTSVPQGRYQNTYQLEDALTWIKGSNTMKFGFDIEDQRIRDGIPFNFYGSIGYQISRSEERRVGKE